MSAASAHRGIYLTSTEAPASSSLASAASAASLLAFSRTGLGAPSTRSLASSRAEAAEAVYGLDDLDLLGAGAGEDDVELVLLLDLGGGPATTGGSGDGDGDGRRGGHTEALLETLSSSSFSSSTVSVPIESRMSSLVAMSCLPCLP